MSSWCSSRWGSRPPGITRRRSYNAGIPITAFISKDIQEEYKQLKARGVIFRSEPQTMGAITSVLFEDTCGNLINLVQPAT